MKVTKLFSIHSVTGWLPGQPKRNYALFDSFHHQLESQKGHPALHYQLHRKQSADSDRIDYSLSFVRSDEMQRWNQEEIISIKALCSNNNLAQNLNIGEICLPAEGIPPQLSLKNITHPSRVMRPILDGGLQWSTISSLSLNYLSLLNKESLSQILQNYNFAALYSSRAEKMLSKLLKSITRFDSTPCLQQYEDLNVRGYESTIHIAPSAFNSEGELYLFGAVIAHFYSQHATVNSFHILNIVNSSTNEAYRWSLMNL